MDSDLSGRTSYASFNSWGLGLQWLYIILVFKATGEVAYG